MANTFTAISRTLLSFVPWFATDANSSSPSCRLKYACNKRLRATTTTWAYVLKRIDAPSNTRYIAALPEVNRNIALCEVKPGVSQGPALGRRL